MLLEFFPNIPECACAEILEHGFRKGSGRVGRSKTLENKLKVQLAVNAHIRHRLTQYDSILAANKGQDAKLAAREIVYGQVIEIADSWRATSFQVSNPKLRTSAPKSSAATLEANRQRRTKRSNSQTPPADGTQVLSEALGGLRLIESQREKGSHSEATQRIAQKVARKAARKGHFKESTRELLRQYELDPSIEMSKKKKKEILHLQMVQKESLRRGNYPQNMNEIQVPTSANPMRRARNRRLRITTNGVELEPRELEPKEPEPREIDRYVPDNGPSDDQPRKSRYPLRSSHRKPSNTPMYSRDLGDRPGDDRYVPTYGLDPSIDRRRSSRYPLRSNYRTPDHFHTDNDERLGPNEEPTSEGRLVVEDPEWMDIDDISLRTAGVHLA